MRLYSNNLHVPGETVLFACCDFLLEETVTNRVVESFCALAAYP